MKKLNCILMAAIASLVLMFSQSALAQQNGVDPNKVYKSWELTKKAEYPGGEIALVKFFEDNIAYPKAALEAGVEGTILVYAILEPDGRILSAQAENELGYGLEAMAEKLVRKSSGWTVGEINGVKVRSEIGVKVPFEIRKFLEKSK